MKLGGPPGETSPHVTERVLNRTSQAIAMEIAKSLDFFTATLPEEKIARLYLRGVCTKASGIIQIVEESVSLPVDIIQPFANVTINPRLFDTEYLKDVAPLMAVSVGLALRKV